MFMFLANRPVGVIQKYTNLIKDAYLLYKLCLLNRPSTSAENDCRAAADCVCVNGH